MELIKNKPQRDSEAKFLKNKLILYSLIIAFLGFLDATYLTILHYKNIIPPCTITNDCEIVLTSKYANIGPIPVALIGSFFYLTVMLVCLILITDYKKMWINVFYALAIAGFVVSLILIFLQIQIIHALCQYCLLSEAASAGILLLAGLNYRKNRS
jgi:uncharacterized membrane protein